MAKGDTFSTQWMQEPVEVLWERDDSQPYEVDQRALVIETATGRVLYISAVGCSCWDGEATADDMGTLRDALGPLGVPVDVRDEAFHALCEQHGVTPTRADDRFDDDDDV